MQQLPAGREGENKGGMTIGTKTSVQRVRARSQKRGGRRPYGEEEKERKRNAKEERRKGRKGEKGNCLCGVRGGNFPVFFSRFSKT
jgi:hypothetical protein